MQMIKLMLLVLQSRPCNPYIQHRQWNSRRLKYLLFLHFGTSKIFLFLCSENNFSNWLYRLVGYGVTESSSKFLLIFYKLFPFLRGYERSLQPLSLPTVFIFRFLDRHTSSWCVSGSWKSNRILGLGTSLFPKITDSNALPIIFVPPNIVIWPNNL